MRRRLVDLPDGYLFNGKWYTTHVEYEAAREAQRERRRRICAWMGCEYPAEWS